MLVEGFTKARPYPSTAASDEALRSDYAVIAEQGPALLRSRYAPLTETLQLVKAPLERVSEALRAVVPVASVTQTHGTLDEILDSLAPYPLYRATKIALLSTRSRGWTAIFANRAVGNGHLHPTLDVSSRLATVGLSVVCRLNAYLPRGVPTSWPYAPERFGARMFTLRYPGRGPGGLAVEHTRSLYLARHSGRRWLFDQRGTALPFEDEQLYRAKRVADRLTPNTIEAYGRRLGVDLFDDDFYDGDAHIFGLPIIDGTQELLSLAEVRDRFGVYALPR
ncbi:hypothetical protein ACFWHR_00620 [Leucobacter sp. NPDC058333]|uniref:hypothetical protein n=1 Tax=Leucobacter sp. NPDC058333 TaxID=3346450 RepID=UPI0036662E02